MAIKRATGDLVTIANTDDIIYAGGYAYMEKAFQDERVGLVFPRVDVDDLRTVTSWMRYREHEWLVPDAYELMKARNVIGSMPMWRRSLHEQHGYMDEEYRVITDYDWTLRLAKAGVGFYYVNEPQGCYTRRADSLEHREHALLQQERAKVRPR
jgi:GT2 family glycosyltransferase